MKHIIFNGQTLACPFFDLFRPLTALELAELEASILEEGDLLVPVQTYWDPDCELSILDGMHRAMICEKHGIETQPWNRGKMPRKLARRRAWKINFARRQLTLEEFRALQASAKGERTWQSVGARAEGKSTRAIAAQTGVSQTQVIRDLAAAAAQVNPPGSPDTVKGSDGKSYPPFSRKRLRKGLVEKMREKVRDLILDVRRLGSTESNQVRTMVVSSEHSMPVHVDQKHGLVWPWLATMGDVLRDLGPQKRVQ